MLVAALAIALLAQPAQAAEPARTSFEICYHHVLRNRTDRELKDVRVYLPVPQSDAYQRISGYRVERNWPVHISNRTDEFGTKMKRVTIGSIPAKGEVEVGFSCQVDLAPPPNVNPEAAARAGEEIPKPVREVYLRDHHIFGLATPEIRQAAAKLLRDHPNPARRARAIHNFVATTLKYKSGDGWDPAPEVLKRRNGSCSEFTYLFCALCRATGIPTRFVGASIFPAKSRAPFDDRGHHRWAQAYLLGAGWVDFDPTLDAGGKQAFVGTHHGRTLTMTRTGDKSVQLGLSYIASNSHTGELSRSMRFTWSQGTMARLDEARKLIGAGKKNEGEVILRELVQNQPGTRAAREAKAILDGRENEPAPQIPDGPEWPDGGG